MKRCVISFALLWIAACLPARADVLMDTVTNNGSFNNPAPSEYTYWDSPTQQAGWTASPFYGADDTRQWSDAATTPNVLPSGNPTVSSAGSSIIGYEAMGSSFTSNSIGTVVGNMEYDLSGWAGYAYGSTSSARRLQLLATDGFNETPLIQLNWLGGGQPGAFTQLAGSYITAASEPLAGQNLIVRANILTGHYASFGDIFVEVNPAPAIPRVILMDATTNNGSFNNPAPSEYTYWDSPTQQAGWTASPFYGADDTRQWSDAATTPNVLPSGNPTVSGAGNFIVGYELNGSSFTSNSIGTLSSNTEYDLSGWAGYAYGTTDSARSLELIATDGVNETPLIQLNWPGGSQPGAFTQMTGVFTTAASDPLAGLDLIVRASILTANFASFGDIVVGATTIPEPSAAVLGILGVGALIAAKRSRKLQKSEELV